MTIVRALAGDADLVAPVDGKFRPVSPDDYEDQVRYLAYGFMVKGYDRNSDIIVTGLDDNSYAFVNAACRLAHLNVLRCDGTDTNVSYKARVIFMFGKSTASASLPDSIIVEADGICSSLDYLIMLGRTWEIKYKPSVDRTFMELLS